jgi:hypothetical protein
LADIEADFDATMDIAETLRITVFTSKKDRPNTAEGLDCAGWRSERCGDNTPTVASLLAGTTTNLNSSTLPDGSTDGRVTDAALTVWEADLDRARPS